MVQDGYEYSSTFEVALYRERKRTKKKIPNFFEPEYYWNYMYFKSGLYYAQVKRYLDLFGDNVFIVKFDDFLMSPRNTYLNICNFLSITPHYVEIKRQNKSKRVYHPILSFLLRKTTNIQVRIRRHILKEAIHSKKSRDVLTSLGIRFHKPKAMLPQTRNLLTDKFSQDILNLSSLINTDLNNWL